MIGAPDLLSITDYLQPDSITMDVEAVKVLLEVQDKTFKTAFDLVVEQLELRNYVGPHQKPGIPPTRSEGLTD